MSGSVIDQQCALLRKQGPTVTVEQLKISFDLFAGELKKVDLPDEKCALIKQMIHPLGNLPYRNKKLSEPELLAHELLIIFRDSVLIDHLRRRDSGEKGPLTLLVNVSNLFMNLYYYSANTTAVQLKPLLFHPSVIQELADCLHEIGTSSKHLDNHALLRSVRYLLMSFKYYLRNLVVTDEYSLLKPILLAVVQCLCSSHAIDMIKSLEQNFTQNLNDGQSLFLDTMPMYLQWYADCQEPENFIRIVRTLIRDFTDWMISCSPDYYVQSSGQVGSMLRHIHYFLVRPIESNSLKLFSEEFYDDYCRLVGHWSAILSSMLAYSPRRIPDQSRTRTILQLMYNFSLHSNVLNYMKSMPNLIAMLLRLTDATHEEMQLNAYRCLGKMMTEADIKTMANPRKIAHVYIEFMSKSIDDPKQTERFASLLECLKNFVQHDQVKRELIDQQALSILIRCVREDRFNPIQIQLVALEILLALSFEKDALTILRDDTPFMQHIHLLADQTVAEKSSLQRAAEGLLWKLEREQEAVSKPMTATSFQYDIMISYSHRDEDICLKIYEQLINDGYRVWLDRNCLRGSTMAGMADAIENSENVLICMSTTYKESVYCQSEAHYAFERGCRLIPIVIELDYKPDGWLGIIVSGKIYVSFANAQFKFAYDRLKSEIEERRDPLPSPLSPPMPGNTRLDHPSIRSHALVALPKDIAQWTAEDVRSFLVRLDLGETILLLCPTVNGPRLRDLYEMCLINRESMYQSLKFELNQQHHTLLPIAHYLLFLNEIKPYVSKPSLPFSFCSVF